MTCEDCGAEMPCRAICDDCIEAYTASDNSDKAELRRERDEALDEKALLRVANANLLAELRQATERAEKAEAERDEARALAIDLYLDANGVGPGRDWGLEEVPSWLSGEGGEGEA